MTERVMSVKTNSKHKRFSKKTISRILLYAIIIALAIVSLIPFYWMIISSLKSNIDVFTIPIEWIPRELHFENYAVIWEKIPLLTFFKNSSKITIIVTILQVFTSSLAAYGFAKLEFKGRNFIFLLYIATIAVPWQAYMVPQFIVMSKADLVDTHLVLILLHAFSAFGVFLLRQFFISIPNELSEAARIDGLNEFGIFSKIVLPLSKPALSTLVIFTFVMEWNDYMGPLIYINSTELKTIQIGIRMFISQYGADYAYIMAASVCSLIPVLIIFVVFQNFFVEGAASSGIKG